MSVCELFGKSTSTETKRQWAKIAEKQECPFIGKKCIKVRKSRPDISIGTCSVEYGRDQKPIVICPHRFLERRRVFTDCLHLLTRHEPGNDLHVVPEISVPGGSVDYFLVSAAGDRPIDFVAIELQTLDTTGTVWPARQQFLSSKGVTVERSAQASKKMFGMNWKMTAKTILVQLHHKVETFDHVSRHLVLVMQDHLLEYMRASFSLEDLRAPALGDPMHIHVYGFGKRDKEYSLALAERWSTDVSGIARALGLQAEASVGLDSMLDQISRKIGPHTLWSPA